MLSGALGVCFGVLESVTCTVKLNGPTAVGVPEIKPAAESPRPGGKDPENSDHVYGVVPPAAERLWLYDTDCVACGRDVVVIASGVATVMLSGALAVCFGVLESVTCTVKLNGPAAVGVPEIKPAVERPRPGGKDPENSAHVYGVVPPAAERLWPYDTDCVACTRDVVVIAKFRLPPVNTTSTQ
jgi:hypothetical protein